MGGVDETDRLFGENGRFESLIFLHESGLGLRVGFRREGLVFLIRKTVSLKPIRHARKREGHAKKRLDQDGSKILRLENRQKPGGAARAVVPFLAQQVVFDVTPDG